MKKILAILLLFSTVYFAQQNNMVTWDTCSIAAGDSLSTTFDLSSKNRKMIGVGVDTTDWVSANLTIDQLLFGGALTSTSTKWAQVQDKDSTALTITLGAIALPKYVHLPPSSVAGLHKVRFVSSVAQDSTIVLYIATRPY